MNPIKVIINNFADETKQSFPTFKITIADFPIVLSLRLITKMFALNNVIARAIYRLKSLSTVRSLSSIISKTNARILQKTQIYANVSVKAIVKMRIPFHFKIYNSNKISLRSLIRISQQSLRTYAMSNIKHVYIVVPYKIRERRDQKIKDIRDLTITEFITKTSY